MIYENVSFPDFVEHLFNLNDFDSDVEDTEDLQNRFLHLALTGQLKSIDEPENSTQYTIHMEQNRITEDISWDIQSVRDYDSLIGFTNSLPYAVPLSLHLIPQAIYQIKHSLHAYVDRTLVEPIMVC